LFFQSRPCLQTYWLRYACNPKFLTVSPVAVSWFVHMSHVKIVSCSDSTLYKGPRKILYYSVCETFITRSVYTSNFKQVSNILRAVYLKINRFRFYQSRNPCIT
jgi:hypothetical protein